MTTVPTLDTHAVRRPLRRHHVVALVAGAGLSAIALFDAATHGVTGHYSVFADDSGNVAAQVVGTVVHGLAYAALVLVLVAERSVFDARRVTRVLHRVLVPAFALLAVGFLVVTPAQVAATGSAASADAPAVLAVAMGVVGTVGFLGVLLGSLVLGLTQWRRPTLGLGGRVLAATGPVLLGTLGLALVAPAWAHPGYLEAVVNAGIALVGVGAVAAAHADPEVVDGATAR